MQNYIAPRGCLMQIRPKNCKYFCNHFCGNWTDPQKCQLSLLAHSKRLALSLSTKCQKKTSRKLLLVRSAIKKYVTFLDGLDMNEDPLRLLSVDGQRVA